MREFRFRVWSNSKKAMYYLSEYIGHPDRLHLSFNNSHWGLFDDDNPVCLANSSSDILMQYTGIKDSEGREIYEGDILKDTLGWVYEVKWDEDNGRFLGYLCKPKGDVYICYVGREPKAMILGNIYENPELLEVQDAK